MGYSLPEAYHFFALQFKPHGRTVFPLQPQMWRIRPPHKLNSLCRIDGMSRPAALGRVVLHGMAKSEKARYKLRYGCPVLTNPLPQYCRSTPLPYQPLTCGIADTRRLSVAHSDHSSSSTLPLAPTLTYPQPSARSFSRAHSYLNLFLPRLASFHTPLSPPPSPLPTISSLSLLDLHRRFQ